MRDGRIHVADAVRARRGVVALEKSTTVEHRDVRPDYWWPAAREKAVREVGEAFQKVKAAVGWRLRVEDSSTLSRRAGVSQGGRIFFP